jgi:hypothetical protein
MVARHLMTLAPFFVETDPGTAPLNIEGSAHETEKIVR